MTRGQRVCGPVLKIGAVDVSQPHLFSLVLRSQVSLLHTHTAVVETQHATAAPHVPKIYRAADSQMACCCKQLSLSGFRSVSLSQHGQPAPAVQHRPSGATPQKSCDQAPFRSYCWLDKVFFQLLSVNLSGSG